MDECLQKHLKDVTYSAEAMPDITRKITADILAGVKRMFRVWWMIILTWQRPSSKTTMVG